MSLLTLKWLLFAICGINTFSDATPLEYNLEDDGFVVIETPGFPAQYPPNLDQMWFFRANKGFRIELLVFELEDDSDFLYILSGFSGFAPPSINFLSGTLPEGTEYYIYDQSMQLHATSDDFVQRRGFRINVTAYDNTTSGGSRNDILSRFRRYPRSYYHNDFYEHGSRGVRFPDHSTAEECANNCLLSRFLCLSFVFKEVVDPTSDGNICIWSAAAPNVDGALADLQQDSDFDLYVRIDTECHPLRVPTLPERCNLPVTLVSSSTQREAMLDMNLFKYSKFGLNQCWQPTTNNESLTMVLVERYVITAIVVHGCDDENLGWVKNFTVMEGLNRNTVETNGGGNVEPRCPSLVTLQTPIHTDVITIKPESYHIGIAMKVDLLGCLENDCDEDVGVVSGTLPGGAFSASSGLNGPFQVRYQPFEILQDHTEGWIGSASTESMWIQVIFPSLHVVRGVVIQGCKEPYQWVTFFEVAYSAFTVPPSSNLDLSWIQDDQNSVKVFSANVDRVTPQRIDFDEEILATTLRLNILTPYEEICMKLAVVGCQYQHNRDGLLSRFRWYPRSYYHNDGYEFEERGLQVHYLSTVKECANKCLQAGFLCLSFVFKEIVDPTTEGNVCIWSAASPNVEGALAELPHDAHFDLFVRIDTECHPMRVPSLPERCNLPVTIISNSTQREALEDTNLFKYSKFGLNECWRPTCTNNSLTIHLLERYVITAIVVHGCDDENLGWVKTFTVMEGSNRFTIETKRAGNVEPRCPSLVTLQNPIHTDVITIKPESYHIGIAMKVDLLGCVDNDCDEDVGVVSETLPDTAFSSSSGLNDPSQVRYQPFEILQEETEGWIAENTTESNWIQVIFPSLYVVRGVIIQGCKQPYPWVTSFAVAYSDQSVLPSSDVGLSWILDNQNEEKAKIFSPDVDRMTPHRIDFDEELLATTLRLQLLTPSGQTCMKLAVVGCRYRSCFRRLGMASGDISPDQIDASGVTGVSCNQAGEFRLFGSPQFGLTIQVSSASIPDQDIVVDLRDVHMITAIATQGTYKVNDHSISTFPTYYVFQYRASPSLGWKTYLNIDGSTKVFSSANNPTSVFINYLARPVMASQIRLVYGRRSAKNLKEITCLRMELFGCKFAERGNVCGSGGLEISGNCFGAVQSRSETSCRDIFQSSSHPAIIHTGEMNGNLQDHVKNLELDDYSYYRIGLKLDDVPDPNLDQQDLLYWYDGSPATFTNFRHDVQFPSDYSVFSSLCVYLSTRDSFTWLLEPCSSLQITPATLCQMDINECLQWNKPCSHMCINIPGSYHCACSEGYYLNPEDEDSCLSLCDFVDDYDALTVGRGCVRAVGKPMTWPDAVDACKDEGGLILESSRTAFLQEDDRFRDLVTSGIWINESSIARNDICHVFTGNEGNASTGTTNCDSVHRFMCTRDYPKSFEIDGGCVEARRLVQVQCPTENVYYDKGYLSWFALPPFYKSRTSTTFHLLVSSGESIRIHFIRVNLRIDGQSICIDKLVVVENIQSSDSFRRAYCGNFQDYKLQIETDNATLSLDIGSLTAQTPQTLSLQLYFVGLNCSVVDCTTECPSKPYTNSSGEIKTPNFPAALNQFYTCTWDIIVTEGHYIRLDFLSVVVICSLTENLVVYDLGDDLKSLPTPRSLEICGKKHISIVSSGRQLRIKLTNGHQRSSQGFHASYHETDVPGCGFFLPVEANTDDLCNAPRAVIANLDYPLWHPNQRTTSWVITTSPGTYIALHFTLFNVQSSSANCQYSYLKITSDETSYVLCNNNFLSYIPDGVYYTHRNSLIVEMTVEDNSNATFTATYSEMRFVAYALPSNEDVFCPTEWTLSGNNCYRMYQGEEVLSWWDAQQTCKDWNKNAFLVVIHSQLEMNFVQHFILNNSNPTVGVYIGLLWDKVERDFRWENGQPLTFTDWTVDRGYMLTQPDGGGLEGCGFIDFWSYRATSNWQDIPCSKKLTGQFVCQQRARSNSESDDVTSQLEYPILTYTEDEDKVCNERQFRCASGECILEVYHCDGQPDCSDGSDEDHCESNDNDCQPTEYECDDGTCVSATFFCDSAPHCRDGSDEYNCDLPNCTNGERRCSQNGRCIPVESLCDLKNDCPDGSDELLCTESKGNFRCFSNNLIPANRVCDGFRDCEGKNWEDESEVCDYLEDPLFCKKTSQFQCRSGACADPSTICLYEMDEYRYRKGCRDDSHLQNCESFQCPVGYFKCPDSYCIPEGYRCNAVMDCPLGEDEIRCTDYVCSPGSYNCHNSHVCLHQHRICDGHLDCIEGDDEFFCEVTCFEGCSCRGLSLTCNSSLWQPDYVRSLSRDLRQLVLTGIQPLGKRNTRSINGNTSDQMSILGLFNIKLEDFPYLFLLDLSFNGIETILPEEFIGNTNLRKLNLSHNQIYTIQSESFMGLERLQYLYLTGNPLTFLSQTPFFRLLHLQTLDIQETNIQNADNDLFDGLRSLKNLYSDKFFFCCLAEFVVEVDKCIPGAGQFSSCLDLMKNKFLRVSLWILGMAAVLGNCGVIFWRIHRKEIIPSNRYNPTQAILILNLAIGDLLLGVYMLIIAVADLSFRSEYYRYSEMWQTSHVCKFAGFLAVLGSEASVMFLAVITVDRFQGVVFPLSSKRLRFSSTIAVSCVVWLVAFCFSAIPLIPFDYFGVSYYGRSSVCLALPLTNDFSPGWLYSVLVFLVFNFICFLAMLLCYAVIYFKASRSVAFQESMKQTERRKKIEEQLQVASKMAFLVVTDMFCWLPIIIMGFLSLIGAVEIPSVIYAWTAVFIMPVNSAMNPYLYTIFVNASKRKAGSSSVVGQSTTITSETHPMRSVTKDDLMTSICSEFKRHRIIVAMTTSQIEKYSLAKLKEKESFTFTGNNKLDLSEDIRKAVTFLHDKGICHGQLREDYVIIEEFPNGEKRAFLLLPVTLLAESGPQEATDGEKRAAARENDIKDLEELVKHFDVIESSITI